MWICIECGNTFDDPMCWEQTHGLDTPPYETVYGSPCCAGSYAKARRCSCCDAFIIGDYIKTDDGERYCENCYQTYELGEED